MPTRLQARLLILLAAINCVPYLWLVLTAFRPRTDITASPPSLGFHFTINNFSLVYNGQHLLSLLANSLVISSGTVVLSLCIGAPAAYYFARHRSRWAMNLFLLVLSTRMAPPIALSLPMFVLFTEVGMRGTYQSVMIAHTIFNMAFVVWFLEGFITGIPTEIEMAAQADGRSRLGALVSVVLPLMKPALTATVSFFVERVHDGVFIKFFHDTPHNTCATWFYCAGDVTMGGVLCGSVHVQPTGAIHGDVGT